MEYVGEYYDKGSGYGKGCVMGSGYGKESLLFNFFIKFKINKLSILLCIYFKKISITYFESNNNLNKTKYKIGGNNI